MVLYSMMGNGVEGLGVKGSEVETAGYPAGGGRQIAECLALGRGASPA